MNITKLLKLSIIAQFSLMVSCQHSNPMNSQLQTEYYLYAANSAKGEVYIVDLETYAVVDTIFNLGDYVRALTITNDGQKLFVHSDQLYKVDLPTKIRSIIQPYGEVYVSPKNIIFLKAEDGLYLIDSITGTATQIDKADIGSRVVFDVTSTKMIGIENLTRGEGGRLVIYDYQTKALTKTDPINLSMGSPVRLAWILPSLNGKQIFFTGAPTSARVSFGVYNLETYKTIFYRPINHLGRLAHSPDDRFIYITERSDFDFQPPTGTIGIIRTDNFQVEDSIAVGYIASLGTTHVSTDKIVIRNDKNIAYVTTFSQVVLIVDLAKKKLIKTIEFSPENYLIHDIVLGQRIK